MKIAIILSGTIRKPENSLQSLQKFAGHEVDVYLHTWRHVERTQAESWSKAPSLEPTPELLASFKPVSVAVEDWEDKRLDFLRQIEEWQQEFAFQTTHLGIFGMLYSLQTAASLCGDWCAYDLVVRLRFDCLLIDDPFQLNQEPGWMIPAGRDYGAVATNDQLGLYWVDRSDSERSRRELFGYFGIYSSLKGMLKSGQILHPETLVATHLVHHNAVVRRQVYDYVIHQRQG